MIVPETILEDCRPLRALFDSGATRSYEFRKQQLLLLRQALLKHDDAINRALYADLKKSPEEAYATETALVLMEIRTALRNLRKWMKPFRAKTNLLNLPSRAKIYKEPLGVVLIIAPWNYPLQLLLAPLVGAIAAGNCAVLKPSELAPATSALLDRIIRETFSTDYIRLIQGDGVTVVPRLIQEFRFDHIFYTGSTTVGRSVYQLAAKELIPVTLELGGKSPAVIESDADLAATVRRIAVGKFTNVGQTCVAPDYLLVHESIKDKFIQLLSETIRQFFGDDPSVSKSYGRIINERRFETLHSYLDQGEIIIGGEHDRQSLYIGPTVIKNVPADSPLMTTEIFGPILPLFTYQHFDEALAMIRRNPDPLAFYLFTSDHSKIRKWVGSIRFGGGCVNNTLWHLANHHLPFGGIGTSGIGAYHGRYSFDVFSHAKPVMTTPTWFDPKIKYPPFDGKLKWFKRMMN